MRCPACTVLGMSTLAEKQGEASHGKRSFLYPFGWLQLHGGFKWWKFGNITCLHVVKKIIKQHFLCNYPIAAAKCVNQKTCKLGPGIWDAAWNACILCCGACLQLLSLIVIPAGFQEVLWEEIDKGWSTWVPGSHGRALRCTWWCIFWQFGEWVIGWQLCLYIPTSQISK